MTREEAEEFCEGEEGVLFADGFDDCILGVVNTPSTKICYNADKMIHSLINKDNLTFEEATEHFSFNIEGAYIGEYTPLYIWGVDTDY